MDGVELTVRDALSPDITEEECRKIAKYAADKKIGLRSLATGADGAAISARRMKPNAGMQSNSLKNTFRSGHGSVRKPSSSSPGATRVAWDPSRPVLTYKTVWEQTTKSVRELVPVAEKLKVNLALENVWNRFLISPMEWKLFLDQFKSEYVGIYFDVGNACLNCRPQDFPEILGKLYQSGASQEL